jgi:hypothetical protein
MVAGFTFSLRGFQKLFGLSAGWAGVAPLRTSRRFWGLAESWRRLAEY